MPPGIFQYLFGTFLCVSISTTLHSKKTLPTFDFLENFLSGYTIELIFFSFNSPKQALQYFFHAHMPQLVQFSCFVAYKQKQFCNLDFLHNCFSGHQIDIIFFFIRQPYASSTILLLCTYAVRCLVFEFQGVQAKSLFQHLGKFMTSKLEIQGRFSDFSHRHRHPVYHF